MKFCMILCLCFYFSNYYAQSFSFIDKLVTNSISNHTTPNANVIIGNDKETLFQKAFGTDTYEKYSTEVTINSIYDLASLTKVFATTLCVMKLVDDNKININDFVAKYITKFGTNDKDSIKIINLLLHNSGLPSYYTPKEKNMERQAVLDSIFNIKKAYTTGSQTIYSCLNFITLMNVVESITGTTMYEFYKKSIIEPLNLTHTYFIPDNTVKQNCISTTPNLKGEVHDPLAHMLKGLSGNAGLFSNTTDLGIICQMMLNKGTYRDVKIFSSETVELFTKQWEPKSSRALGWDTNGFLTSSAGTLFSPVSYGHTGYTGTSVWIDPIRKLFVVLLTNRVYPDDSAVVSDLRKQLHNYTIMELENLPTEPIIEFYGIDSNKGKVIINKNNEYISVDKTDIFVNSSDKFAYYDSLSSNSNYVLIENIEKNKINEVKLLNNKKENISTFSSTFGFRGDNPNVLIINACKGESTAKKALNLSAREIYTNLHESISFECSAIDYAKQNLNLSDYQIIVLYSSEDSYFPFFEDSSFVNKLQKYILNGGNLLVSGSEFGWFLGRTESGVKFNKIFSELFNSKYIKDNSNCHNILGLKDSKFDGLKFSFGTEQSIFITKTSDVIAPVNNAETILEFENGGKAGISALLGKGKIVYLSFPIETINEKDVKVELFKRIFDYFMN